MNNERVYDKLPYEQGIRNLALPCDSGTLYFSSLTSRYLYAISVTVLSEYLEDPKINIREKVIDLGYKWSASEGMTITNKGDLIFTGTEDNSIHKVDNVYYTMGNIGYNHHSVIYANATGLIWPCSLSFTPQNELLVLSNKKNKFLLNSYNFSECNFSLWSIAIDDNSYLHECDYETTNSGESSLPIWVICSIFFAVLMLILALYCSLQYFFSYKRRQQRAVFSSRVLL